VRLSELHLAAAAADHGPAFAPEPFTILTRRSMYQHVRTRLLTVLQQVQLAERMPPDLQAMVAQLQDERPALLALIGEVLATPLTGRRIRCHGNLHLGQVLHAGRDLLIIDFEGEAEQPLFDRIAHELGTESHFGRGWVRYALRDMLSIARSAQ
jgi:maltose alpha-D-glucosyltransferase/alpha-amylase